MNNGSGNEQETLRSLLLMAELEEGRPISQREIAGRLGIALGLVNAYLKTLMKKGFVQVQAYPRNRYAYLLTPRGFAEKSRLAYQHLSNFHKLYSITRADSLAIFVGLRERGIRRVAFCGVDDLTEIAYLSLREAQMELAAVMDHGGGAQFFEHSVVSFADGVRNFTGPYVVTSLPRAVEIRRELLAAGAAAEDIVLSSHTYEEVLR